jgi:hypothetical protein
MWPRTTMSCWRRSRVLSDEGCPGFEEGLDEVEQEAKERDHGSERYHDGLVLARRATVRGRVVAGSGRLRT